MEQTVVGYDEKKRWLTMTRGTALVACNFAEGSQRIPFSGLEGKEMAAFSKGGIIVEEDAILLPAEAIAIWVGRENNCLSADQQQIFQEGE